MSESYIAGEKFQARCQRCGRWQEVSAAPQAADLYFEYWRARFICCGQEQSAWFTVEKVDDDIH